MFDYELLEGQPGGGYVGVTLQTPSGNVEESGDLFCFTTETDTRYYLAYSKACRLAPVNEAPDTV